MSVVKMLITSCCNNMQNTDRFLDPNIPDEMAASIRPRVLADFIGHDSLKQNLSVFISGAKSRG